MHDLVRIRKDIQEGLSVAKHPVALLLGAGCPVAVRVSVDDGKSEPLIPDIAGLTRLVASDLAEQDSFRKLQQQFEQDGYSEPTVEDFLSRIRLLSRIVGVSEARGLNASELRELEREICESIARRVNKQLPAQETPYHLLAGWVGGMERTSPLHLFTTNYDLLLEQALEEAQLPFFDGFVGSHTPFFDLRAIEGDALPHRWTRIWKMHGSLNWHRTDAGLVVRMESLPDAEGLLIHPSELKYDQSRRMPYLAMIDQLRAFLRLPSALLVSIGYSWADEHLNEVIIEGLRGNPTAAGHGLLFKNLDEEPGAQKVAGRLPANLYLLARDCGVVRGSKAPWKAASSETSRETQAEPPQNSLGDFADFCSFLSELSSPTRV